MNRFILGASPRGFLASFHITEGSEVFIAVGDQIHRKEYSLKDQFGESPWSMSDEKYKTMEEVEASM